MPIGFGLLNYGTVDFVAVKAYVTRCRIPLRDREGPVSRNNRERVVLCHCLDGHVKDPYEMFMVWYPERMLIFSLVRLYIYKQSYKWLKYRRQKR